MSRTSLKFVAVAACMLLAVGCAQQKTETTPPPAETEVEVETPEMMTLQLTPEKVNELAVMTVEIERDPTTTNDVLLRYNMTQEQYSDAMMRVQADSTMMMMFNQAKATAQSAPGGAMGDTAAGH